MASGMASSQRGVAGIGERRVGYNPCGACEVGRWMAGILYAMLVDGRPICKLRAGRGRGSHKGSYGTAGTGDGTSAVTAAAARTTGGRSPAPARTRTGPGRDAAARITGEAVF